MIRGVIIVGLIAAALAVAGCTDLERKGYSPIPQNSPGAWEINPYN